MSGATARKGGSSPYSACSSASEAKASPSGVLVLERAYDAVLSVAHRPLRRLRPRAVELFFPDDKCVVDLDRASAYLDSSLHALGRKAGVGITETLVKGLGRSVIDAHRQPQATE